MTEGPESKAVRFMASDLRQIEASWKVGAPYEVLIADDIDLEFHMKLSGRINTAESHDSTIEVIASADAAVRPADRGHTSPQLPDEALHVRAVFAVIISPSSAAETCAEAGTEPSSEARCCALRAAYPLLRQELSRGFQLGGYPPPDLPLSYDEYGDQAHDVEPQPH